MINELKYYISKETDPYINLAVEKYLLDNVSENCCILYLWQNENTVVIGKNQNPWAECRCELSESEGVKIARRLSGGGAVYHDLGNLNFTFISSSVNLDVSKNAAIIVAACRMAGIKCELSGRNDILANGRKFSGNAFYNSHGKSYHHGTLLVSSDKTKLQKYLTPPLSKLESKGVKSVKARVINLSELSENITIKSMTAFMLKAFENAYVLAAEEIPTVSTDKIIDNASLYRSWEYIYGSTFPFSYSFEGRFSWGHINLMINVEKGIITSAKTYTDSIDVSLPYKISKALSGCRFTRTDISSAITKNGLPVELNELIKTHE